MRKFWSGDMPLSVAYWVYGWVLSMGLALVIAILGVTLVPGSVPALLFLFAICCYAVFWGVGTWRAASKYQGLKVWAVLAKAHIAVPLTLLALGFATLTFVKQQGGTSESSVHKQTNVGSDPFSPVDTVTQLPERPANSKNAIPSATVPPATSSPIPQEDKKAYRVEASNVIDFDEAMRRMDEIAPQFATPEPAKRLGWLDQLRYESCQQDAAKAPTPQGVTVGLRICREKFGQ